jgi:NADH-quinone oxidoreductase subunit L
VSTSTLAALVPLLPFLGAVAGLLLGRRAPGFARPLAVLPTLLATALAVTVAVRQGGGGIAPGAGPGTGTGTGTGAAASGTGGAAVDFATTLTPTGNSALPVQLALHVDGFAALVAVLVGAVATCVQLYSTGYLRDDPRYASYAALVSLFTSAMLLVVYADDLIVLLAGWEVMGICSYFLVGHYWETRAARAASLKAFLVTKLGDVPFLIGVFVLASDAGTFRISTITARLTSQLSGFDLAQPTLVALLLLAGVAGKSAQFPLHTWLPDAMAGPTPVSALIHAATMVAAGVYVVARLLPVFASSSAALLVLAVVAAVTMAGSALAALAQDDVKRVLAYSTIGQLGYMTGALAVGDRGAAVFHLLTHGAFKALLFLAAGVLIHAAGTNSLAAMARMGGLNKLAPDAYWTMTIGLLALTALPPFSGFFSKEAVLAGAEHAAYGAQSPQRGTGVPAHAADHAIPAAAGWIVLAAGVLTALLTAAYATRLWLLAFRGAGRGVPAAADTTEAGAAGTGSHGGDAPHADHAEGRQGEHARTPPVLNVVLWILAIPSLVLGLAFTALPGWFGEDDGSLTPELPTSVLATGVSLIGVIAMYAAWRHLTADAAALSRGPSPRPPEGVPGEAPPPLGAVAAHPHGDPALSEEEAIASHEPAYGDIAAVLDPPDPADPARLLLGPLHRPAARGFRLDAVYSALAVRPTLATARLVRRADRAVLDALVRAAAHAPRQLGGVVRRSQNGNAQSYLSALAVGSVVLAVAAVLVATGTSSGA